MSQKKQLFVNSVKIIKVDDRPTIPTALYYKDKRPLVGFEAIETCDYPELINDDFKVELGKKDPAGLISASKVVGHGHMRSPIGLAKDFIESVLEKANVSIERDGFSEPSRILIAEPLSFTCDEVTNDTWLSNYRASVRQILYGKFGEIDFMPEPFAVFQYYRYGVRHPLVTGKTKHTALVLDFGGGTFDVSVIETTNQGDISQSGRNSRPLSAKSTPVGGFYINNIIAENIIRETIKDKKERKKIDKWFKYYKNSKNLGPNSHEHISDEGLNFLRNLKTTLQSVERAKVVICSNIANWDLGADLSKSTACQIRIPSHPCSSDPRWTDIRLDASRLRELFEKEIWEKKLKSAINNAITLSEKEPRGGKISIALLSGGSSNIRWIKPLIERDLSERLNETEVLELHENFQEIVAKGLAIECSRRFFTEGEGDFRAVTYNRLCLALRSDDDDLEIKRFKKISSDLTHDDADDGVLLPSSSSLRRLIDTPLRWKVRLNRPPRHKLEYYFMRGSFDPGDHEALYSIIDKSVRTPSNVNHGRGIEIELTVGGDGTAKPRFIYGKGKVENRTVVDGRPFYLDMTYGAEEKPGDTYLGFDFGSSTSSFSFVKQSDIKVYLERSEEKSWLELNELAAVLPYPCAAPLISYIGETGPLMMNKWGRETVEAILTMAAYLIYTDYCSTNANETKIFKNLRHRSAGPLWHMIRESLALIGDHATFSQEYACLIDDHYAKEIDDIILHINLEKHGKMPDNINYQRIIIMLGNVTNRVFSNKLFGFFEDTKLKPFSADQFCGFFRNAKGSSMPFIDLHEYEGNRPFSPEHAYLYDTKEKNLICLSPLMYWGLDSKHQFNFNELYIFDTVRENKGKTLFGFKAVSEGHEFAIDGEGNSNIIFDPVSQMRSRDQDVKVLSDLSIKPRQSEYILPAQGFGSGSGSEKNAESQRDQTDKVA